MYEIEVLSALLGSVVGLILALTGAGGAMLAIPLLVLFLNLTISQAAPIALLAVFLASSIGAIEGLLKRLVRYKTAMLIATVGMVSAPIGTMIALRTPNVILNFALILILLLIGLQNWKISTKAEPETNLREPPACLINPVTSRLFWTASCTKRLIGTGVLSGLLSGLLGVGGGFIIRPSLSKVSNFNNQSIIATTLASVALISISSIASQIGLSQVNWHIAIPFIISTIITMLVVSNVLAHKISKQTSHKGFAILCLIAAIHMSITNLT